jgi:hypothetical protein
MFYLAHYLLWQAGLRNFDIHPRAMMGIQRDYEGEPDETERPVLGVMMDYEPAKPYKYSWT